MTPDQARAVIQCALSEKPGPVGSPAGYFSGKGKDQGQTVGGTEPVGFSPTRIHAKESQKTGTAKIPTASGVSGSTVRTTIRELPALHQLWIGYLYGNGSSFMSLESHAQRDFQSRHPFKNIQIKTRNILTAMLETQIANAHGYYSFTLWSPQKPLWLDSITQKQWHQTYIRYWKSVRSYLQALDLEALSAFIDRFDKNA